MNSDNDFFHTGGGFSDWSGKSAGRFNSGNGHSSSGDGGYGVPSEYISDEKKKEWIENEKRHGLHKDADALPKFMSKRGLAFRSIRMLLFQMVPIPFVLAFCNNPNNQAKMIVGICVLIVVAISSFLCTRVKNWYPDAHKLTKKGLKRFLLGQDLAMIGISMTGLFFVLTPLWRYLTDYYFGTLFMERYGGNFFLQFDLDALYIIGMIISAQVALIPFFSVLTCPLCTKDNLESRWEYLRYKMGQLDKAESDRLEKVAELEKRLEAKKKELADLMGQISALRNNQNV